MAMVDVDDSSLQADSHVNSHNGCDHDESTINITTGFFFLLLVIYYYY